VKATYYFTFGATLMHSGLVVVRALFAVRCNTA